MNGRFRRNPWWFHAINRIWGATYPVGTAIRLDKDSLLREAKRKAGLDDLGRDFFDEPLERLLWAINHEAGLHPIGRMITRERFISLLSIRLRAEYFFKKYPAILEQEIYPAWIIVGLQRTGTTKLQRILAVDPDHRVIPSWEVINPMPVNLHLYDEWMEQQNRKHTGVFTAAQGMVQTELSPGDSHVYSQKDLLTGAPGRHFRNAGYPDPRDKRIPIARLSVNAVRLMSPGFFAVHPIDAMQPEEDILMLDVSFMSTTPEAMMPVDSYSSWLEQTDQSMAYAYAAKMLKFLQWINPASRWVLKTPHHLEFPDLLEKHFGNVHFLWPHRSLYESVPSYLSMLTYNHMMFCMEVDPQRVARHWIRKTGYMLRKALDYRLKDSNNERFTDIWYHDLVTRSEEELSKIYDLNGGLSPALLEKFKVHEAAHPHRKFGTHHYQISDFGMSNDDIDQNTRHYQDFLKAHYG